METGHSYEKLGIFSVENDKGEISIKMMIRDWARDLSGVWPNSCTETERIIMGNTLHGCCSGLPARVIVVSPGGVSWMQRSLSAARDVPQEFRNGVISV